LRTLPSNSCILSPDGAPQIAARPAWRIYINVLICDYLTQNALLAGIDTFRYFTFVVHKESWDLGLACFILGVVMVCR